MQRLLLEKDDLLGSQFTHYSTAAFSFYMTLFSLSYHHTSSTDAAIAA
jgi:hypothetical protein